MRVRTRGFSPRVLLTRGRKIVRSRPHSRNPLLHEFEGIRSRNPAKHANIPYCSSETSCIRKMIRLTVNSSLEKVNRTDIPFFGYTSEASPTSIYHPLLHEFEGIRSRNPTKLTNVPYF